ncbi:hypothetical protein [Flexivirga oryzae]|uniref:Uncharacterized protein n=1 Tax=Flexivirga oryzae TaxID=1794944 RepID=A0A839NG71_9MICO|nr:hypothetical protein [Flexivirga oryzae]MBB2893462.1 hypothetical protein [Flexivirga oryzae]
MVEASRESIEVAGVERGALVRRAQERLVRIEDIRAASRLRRGGRTQRQIAEILHVTQPRVHRMLIAAEAIGDGVTPEEVILRATVDGADRGTLVQTLAGLTYTFTEYAPGVMDGSRPGTWLQVEVAAASGLLTEDEFDRVRAVVQPPAP